MAKLLGVKLPNSGLAPLAAFVLVLATLVLAGGLFAAATQAEGSEPRHGTCPPEGPLGIDEGETGPSDESESDNDKSDDGNPRHDPCDPKPPPPHPCEDPARNPPVHRP